MPEIQVHQCQCEVCQGQESHPDQVIHHQINLFMSRLNEQQRRWYGAVEAHRLGQGGIVRISQITGLSEPTIRRGKEELEQDLRGMRFKNWDGRPSAWIRRRRN